MVQDKSAGFKDTWEFLDRRIEDVINLHSLFDLDDGKKTKNLERVLGSAFSTVFFQSISASNPKNYNIILFSRLVTSWGWIIIDDKRLDSFVFKNI